MKEYGKRLPIEWIQYDDKRDHGTMVRLLEKHQVPVMAGASDELLADADIRRAYLGL